jgi:serine protease Do
MVTPSVVAIDTEFRAYDFFNRPVQREGAGSGWIFDSEGIVITNDHVISEAHEIKITLSDGSILPATLVGGDALTDIAVLQIAASGVSELDVADSSDIEQGDWVLAIGNSLGLGVTVKEGIVSRLNVSLPIAAGQTVDDLIETSAAINPGNSGGPLINMEGKVIGITSIKIGTAGVEGLGYAINVQQAIPIIEELINNGYVTRPWLGVSVGTVNEFVANEFNLAVEEGALVIEVVADSPAEQGGILQGDVIVAVGDIAITNVNDLRDAIHTAEIGSKIEITYWRKGKQSKTNIILSVSPKPQ